MKHLLVVIVFVLSACCREYPPCECPATNTSDEGEPGTVERAATRKRPALENAASNKEPAQKPKNPDQNMEQARSLLPPVFPEECKAKISPPPPTPHHRSWRELAKIRVGVSHLDTVDVSTDETLLLTMSANEGSIRIYDIVSRKLLGNFGMIPEGSFERGAAVFWRGRSAKQMFLFGGEQGIFLHDARTGELLGKLSDQPCWEMSWTEDNQYLVVNLPDISSQSSRMVFFEATESNTLREARRYSFEDRVDGWDLSCDGRLFAATFYPTDDLRLYDLAPSDKPLLIWQTPAPRYSNDVDISPEGNLVAVGGDHLLLLNIQEPENRSVFEKYNNNIDTVQFHPDGGAIVTTSYDGQVQLIRPSLDNPEMPRLKRLAHRGTANVYGIAFYKNGSRMVTSSGDRTLRIWGHRGKQLP